MDVFVDYKDAYKLAQQRANEWNRDMGVEKIQEYGKTMFKVTFLPAPNKCFGRDMFVERVTPMVCK